MAETYLSPTFQSTLPLASTLVAAPAVQVPGVATRIVSPTYRSTLPFGGHSNHCAEAVRSPRLCAKYGQDTNVLSPRDLPPNNPVFEDRGRRHFSPRAKPDPFSLPADTRPYRGMPYVRGHSMSQGDMLAATTRDVRRSSSMDYTNGIQAQTEQTRSHSLSDQDFMTPTMSPRSSPLANSFREVHVGHRQQDAPHRSSGGVMSCSRFGLDMQQPVSSPRASSPHQDSSGLAGLLSPARELPLESSHCSSPRIQRHAFSSHLELGDAGLVSTECGSNSHNVQAKSRASSRSHAFEESAASPWASDCEVPSCTDSLHPAQTEADGPLLLRPQLSPRSSVRSPRRATLENDPAQVLNSTFFGSLTPAELRAVGKDIRAIRDSMFCAHTAVPRKAGPARDSSALRDTPTPAPRTRDSSAAREARTQGSASRIPDCSTARDAPTQCAAPRASPPAASRQLRRTPSGPSRSRDGSRGPVAASTAARQPTPKRRSGHNSTTKGPSASPRSSPCPAPRAPLSSPPRGTGHPATERVRGVGSGIPGISYQGAPAPAQVPAPFVSRLTSSSVAAPTQEFSPQLEISRLASAPALRSSQRTSQDELAVSTSAGMASPCPDHALQSIAAHYPLAAAPSDVEEGRKEAKVPAARHRVNLGGA